MPDTKERLSQLWLFTLLTYLYADVVALFAIVGSPAWKHDANSCVRVTSMLP